MKLVAPKKKKFDLPPLHLIDELLVLGGRYRFSLGRTKRQAPLLYISMPGSRGGLSILIDNLPSFRSKFEEVLEKIEREGGAEARLSQPPIQRQALAEKEPKGEIDKKPVDYCLGPSDQSWRAVHEIQGGLESNPEVFEPHESGVPLSLATTACTVCTYDPEQVDYYKKSAGILATPSKLGESRSPMYP